MADSGDWTWVLERKCDECGYDASALTLKQLGPRIRAVAGEWRTMLGRGPAIERLNDNDERTWTPLEYGCHVRDVLWLFEGRIRRMLKKRKPTFKDWDQEEAAAVGDYSTQDPAKAAYALASNAGKLADLVDRLSGDEWPRQGVRSDGAEFTIESIVRYVLHDIEHHLWDAHEQLDG